MKNKDVEKKLIAALEVSDQIPNPHILDAAKKEIQTKNVPVRHSNIPKFAIAGCVCLVLCLAIVLPILLIHNGNNPNNQIHTQTIASMQEYFNENNVSLIALSEMSASFIEEAGNKTYIKKDSAVIMQGETALFVQELYLYENEEITQCVILDTADVVKREHFSDYNDCESIYTVSDGHSFFYSYNEEQKLGFAFTEYNGYTIYFKIRCEVEQKLFEHFINFIELQKN
ncbi:MAG: hypothetical protein IJ226_02265 [Clostridia bacterium]|nr:hypothetical protein [Clostridia bacterium]